MNAKRLKALTDAVSGKKAYLTYISDANPDALVQTIPHQLSYVLHLSRPCQYDKQRIRTSVDTKWKESESRS